MCVESYRSLRLRFLLCVATTLMLAVIACAGPQGLQGDVGSQGPQGNQGQVGPQGPPGTDGAKGPMGPMGPPGPQGEIGPEGQRGDTGPKGDQGPQGERGEVGPQGKTGPAGSPGEKGEEGLVGPSGPRGQRGAQGPRGPAGEAVTYSIAYAEGMSHRPAVPDFIIPLPDRFRVEGIRDTYVFTWTVPARGDNHYAGRLGDQVWELYPPHANNPSRTEGYCKAIEWAALYKDDVAGSWRICHDNRPGIATEVVRNLDEFKGLESETHFYQTYDW